MDRRQMTAFVVSVMLAVIYLLLGIWNPIPGLLEASLFSAAAAGIWRGDAWSAVGAALLLVVPIAGKVAAFARDSLSNGWNIEAAFGHGMLIVWTVVPAILLLWAVRSLSAANKSSAAFWCLLGGGLIAGSILYRPYIATTGSMRETLLPGDRVLVRQPLLAKPVRGQIVCVHYPVNPKMLFIKRVIGIGGDRIRIANKKVFVNGAKQDEAYVVHKSSHPDSFRDNFPSEPGSAVQGDWATNLPRNVIAGELIVPSGKTFVLGDNRDESLDSRYWGFIDETAIAGTPALVYFSVDLGSSLVENNTLPPPALFTPEKIRWSRIFRVL